MTKFNNLGVAGRVVLVLALGLAESLLAASFRCFTTSASGSAVTLDFQVRTDGRKAILERLKIDPLGVTATIDRNLTFVRDTHAFVLARFSDPSAGPRASRQIVTVELAFDLRQPVPPNAEAHVYARGSYLRADEYEGLPMLCGDSGS